MYVNPFWFGFGVGIIVTIVVIAVIAVATNSWEKELDDEKHDTKNQ